MRLHVVQRHAFGVEEGLEGADLVAGERGEFFGCHGDFAASEALDVWQAGVCADEYVVGFAEEDCVVHY